jgi:hypothetical protein
MEIILSMTLFTCIYCIVNIVTKFSPHSPSDTTISIPFLMVTNILVGLIAYLFPVVAFYVSCAGLLTFAALLCLFALA